MNPIRLISALLITIMAVGTGAAQTQDQDDREYRSAVQVTFFPPLGTNGLHSARYTNRFSLNILAGTSANEQAFALAGLTNVILNDASGFQLAGLANYTGGRAHGFQFAGLANIVRGDHRGFQFGGLANTARNVEGFQFGGLGNVARDVEGFQFGGLFNVARRVKGAQFAGLLNIAESSDYPVGIVNIIREGEMGIAIGYNEIGTTSLTFRSGGRVLYGILGVGYNHKVEGENDGISIMGGYGAHINILPWLRINNELTMESIDGFNNEHGNTFKASYALLPAFRLHHFELFGGPSVNFMQTKDPGMFDLFPRNQFWKETHTPAGGQPDKLMQAFIGWQVGVQYIF